MKRMGIWAMAFLLSLTLVACDSTDIPTQEPGTATEQQAEGKPEETTVEAVAAETKEVLPDSTALAAAQVADTWQEIGQTPEELVAFCDTMLTDHIRGAELRLRERREERTP